MKKLLLSIFLSLFVFGYNVSAQIFSQNFNSSTVVSDYVDNVAPSTSKFDAISTTNPSTAGASIVGNTLRLNRTANTSGTVRFARITDLTVPIPTFLAIKFKLTVSGNTIAKLSAATFVVGTNFTTNAAADADINGRFSINLTATDGTFSLRKFKPSVLTSSTSYSGSQNIAYYINNTGSLKTYIAPDGSVEAIADKMSDLWVGTAKVFDETPEDNDVAISDFKFIFDGGSASPFGFANIDIDDIIINDQAIVLPISLISFSGKADNQNINLNWQTTSEKNNGYFEVLRSLNGKNFTAIGKIDGSGTSSIEHNYTCTDNNPASGINYYQLKQVDFDGKSTLSDIISIKSKVMASSFKILANRDKNSLDVNVFSRTDGIAQLSIFDVIGKKIIIKTLNLNKGYNTFNLPLANNSKGVHIATLNTANEIITNKFTP